MSGEIVDSRLSASSLLTGQRQKITNWMLVLCPHLATLLSPPPDLFKVGQTDEHVWPPPPLPLPRCYTEYKHTVTIYPTEIYNWLVSKFAKSAP